MKKGCFLTIVVVATIIIGVGFYIFKKYGSDIENFGREKVVEYTFDSGNEYFEKLKNKEYTDSLKIIWKKVYDSTADLDFKERLQYLGNTLGEIELRTKDSLITPERFKSIKEYIKSNEKPKEN